MEKKDAEKIAAVIRNFDIVALQEVFNTTGLDTGKNPALETLIKNYLPGWDYAWERPTGRRAYELGEQASEGFAFLWNKSKFSLPIVTLDSGEKRTFVPRVVKQYRLDRTEKQTDILRDPYFGRFLTNDGSFIEIRLINIHITFNKSKMHSENEKYPIDDLSSVKIRKNEFNVITKSIYPTVQNKIYGGTRDSGANRDVYTIILGDYNLNLENTRFNLKNGTSFTNPAPYLDEIVYISDNSRSRHGKMEIQTVQYELTSLKKIIKEEDPSEYKGFANNYDHFSFDRIKFQQNVTYKTKRINTVNKLFNGDFERHREKLSDHIPIEFDFNLK